MWFIVSWIGRIVAIALLAVFAVAGWGIWFVASDQPIDATVEERDCAAVPTGESHVVVKTKSFGFKHTAPVTFEQCRALPDHAFVQYHVRSGRTLIYEFEGGACIIDTGNAPTYACK